MNATNTIAILYCCALLVAVMFAPYSWAQPGYQHTPRGFFFVLTAPYSSDFIDKGKLAMEIVGITALAAGAWVITRRRKS